MKTIISIFVVCLALLFNPALASESNTSPGTPVSSLDSAIKIALAFTGFEVYDSVTVNEIILDSITKTSHMIFIPFLDDSIDGKKVWLVKFYNTHLGRPCKNKDSLSCRRTFTVYIDQSTEKLLQIHYMEEGYNRDSSPLPTLEQAESQMLRTAERYHNFPDSMPEYKFLEALDNTASNPLSAKEIFAYYITESSMDSGERRVWAIDLRGLYPIPKGSRLSEKYTPSYMKDHRRTIIDASTGKSIFTTTVPQGQIIEID